MRDTIAGVCDRGDGFEKAIAQRMYVVAAPDGPEIRERRIVGKAYEDDIIDGRTNQDDNPLINAPHTAEEIAGRWTHAYSRETAAYPVESLRSSAGWVKYWSPIKRVDVAYGDRNLAVTLPASSDVAP